MAGSISVRIERKKITEANGQNRHDLRLKVPNYVDKTKTGENSVLVAPKTGEELFEVCKALRAQRQTKRGIKKNINVSLSGIITFSTESKTIIENLPKERQNELFLEASKKIGDYLKVDITGLTVHRDESSIHAHFQAPAFNREGYPLSDLIGPKELSGLQDAAAEAFKELGIDRGIKKIDRIQSGEDYAQTIHRSVRQLHNDLPAEIQKKQEQVAELEQKRQEQEAAFERQKQNQAAKLQEKAAEIKELERQKQEQERQKQEIEKKISNAEEVLKAEKVPEPPAAKIIREKVGWFRSENRKVIDYYEYKAHEKKLLEWAANSFNQNNEKRKNELQEKENSIKEQLQRIGHLIKESESNKNLLEQTAIKITNQSGLKVKEENIKPRAADILKNYISGGIEAVKIFWIKIQNALDRTPKI